MAKKKTKKASGLSIERNGTLFTLKWKIGDSDYGAGQTLEYTVNGTTYKPSISKTAVSYSIPSSQTSYSSICTVKTITFKVRGKRKKKGNTVFKWSDWEIKSWNATKPKKPTIEFKLTGNNMGTFTWSVSNDNTSTEVYQGIQYQTTTRNDNTNNPKISGNVSSNSNKSGSWTYTEDAGTIATKPVVRWVRLRSKGPVGYSDWVYAHHSYATPNAPILKSASAKKVGSVSQITAEWQTSATLSKPIDVVTVQYAIDKPTDAALSAPSGGWSDVIDQEPKGASDKAVVKADDYIGTDECLWVRVKTVHDNLSNYSNAMVAQVGKLAAPTINATPNFSTGAVSISITEQTACTVANTAIFYRTGKDAKSDRIIGVLAHGTTSGSYNVPELVGRSTSCFGAFAFVGSYSGLKIDPKMTSAKAVDNDDAAVAPASVTIAEGPRDGTVLIGWAWSWTEATSAELSWSEHEEAWQSTDEPKTYKVSETGALNWVIADLEPGEWFFRVRLIGEVDGEEVVGPWSNIVSYNLSSAPDRPVLNLGSAVINEGDTLPVRWTYSSSTGEQEYAEVAIVDTSENPAVYTTIGHTDVESSLDIEYPFVTGATYNLVCRVTVGGMQSAWSNPVELYVAAPITVLINTSSITAPTRYTVSKLNITETYVNGELTDSTTTSSTETITPSGGITAQIYKDLYTENGYESIVTSTAGNTVTIYRTRKTAVVTSPANYYPSVVSLPMTVTLFGADLTGTQILSIVRADEYHVDRPDDKKFDGYEGETIYTASHTMDPSFTITADDLVGSLDDGAKYKLIATLIDEYGQVASTEMHFMVNWSHKADVPSATVQVDKYARIAKITPAAPEGYVSGDVCDIYRITVDQPELIYKGAIFGTTYVDPYPAFGDFCGHRIVTRTADGSYVSSSGLAWYDTDASDGDLLEEQQMIIDVDGNQIELPYNITLRNKWAKDFKRTSYLGGSVQGDWNPAILRDLTAETVIIRGDDLDKQLAMRDLAGYAGVAHIRTPDGSSLTCDIQIDEAQAYSTKKISYTLTVLAIDPGEPSGMTLAEWEAMNAEE